MKNARIQRSGRALSDIWKRIYCSRLPVKQLVDWRGRVIRGKSPQFRPLQEQEADVERIQQQVPPPEALRLLKKAVEPFEPHLLQVGRRLWQQAGVKVERRT